jgi:hypothetical protein
MTIYKEVTKDVGYEVTKLRDNNATYRDNKITVNMCGACHQLSTSLCILCSQVV